MSFFDAMGIDDITLNGLEKWTSHLFEQLGWMTLANETGGEDKVSSYIISMKKLKNSIESRLKIITSEDARIDLENLLYNIKHLMKITSSIFNKEHIRKTICTKCALPIEHNNSNITISDQEIKNQIKQNGGTKSKILTNMTNKVSNIKSKTQSKKSSKKLSKIQVKKTSKIQTKKNSKKISDKQAIAQSIKSSKKQLKKQSKKSKINLKKNKDEHDNKVVFPSSKNSKINNFDPLINKLTNKSSMKTYTDIYKKTSKK